MGSWPLGADEFDEVLSDMFAAVRSGDPKANLHRYLAQRRSHEHYDALVEIANVVLAIAEELIG